MNKQTSIFMLFALLFFAVGAFAQTQNVSGTVVDENGDSVVAATVNVTGTNIRALTGLDGEFSIQAPTDAETLTISFVGLETQVVPIGNGVVNITMGNDDTALEGVVVTAYGIEREEQALGYAVTELSSDQVANKPENDVGRVLRGKAPGVRVTGSGSVSGSGTNIIIRGYSSITGNNQPLFIVDGVPISSTSSNANDANPSAAFQGANNSSRFSDIDPNDIESISVLKGLAASNLYGSLGKNGVILITTKSGKNQSKGSKVSFNQSLFFTNVVLPDYQDNWGAGFQNSYGPFFSNWGQRFDQQETIPNPYYRYRNLFPDDQFANTENIPYVPYDSQESFFDTGVVSTTSLSISGNNGSNGTYSMSYGRTDDQGFIPNNEFVRNNFSIGGNFSLNEKVTFGGKLNYVNSNFDSPLTDASSGSDVVASADGSVGGLASIWNVLYIPRSVNIDWPSQHPVTGQSLWYRGGEDRMNPRWASVNTKQVNDVNRLFGNFSTGYQITDWVSLQYRLGIDAFASDQLRTSSKGGRDGLQAGGFLQTGFQKSNIWDHNVYASFDEKEISDFTISGLVGATSRREVFDSDGQESNNQVVFGLANHSNFITNTTLVGGTVTPGASVPFDFSSEQNLLGLYGQATADYNGLVYLNLSGRNDWSSTHEKGNNSKFYPSASVSFLPVDIFGLDAKKVDYLKVRAGYGTSAGFATPYNTRQTANLVANSFQTIGGSSTTTVAVSSALANSDLKPELTEEIEFGIEGRFFGDRLGIDFTFYDRNTNDLIVNRPLPAESGFTSVVQNVGDVQNKGVEIALNVVPIQKEDWALALNGSFTRNVSEISGLAEGEQIYGSGLFVNPANYLINGEQYGVIFGSRYSKDANGNNLVDENGYWITDPENGIIGDPNPDWFMTGGTSFNYKKFRFNTLWEYQQGGDIFSTSVGTLLARGLAGETDFDRTQGVILPGTRQSTGQPNDIQITATEAFFDNIGFGNADEASVYDATHMRLREVSLSYDVPKDIFGKTFIEGASVSFLAQNPWVKAFNVPESVNYDPEVNSLGVGNSQGLDYLTSWNSRRYGVNLGLKF